MKITKIFLIASCFLIVYLPVKSQDIPACEPDSAFIFSDAIVSPSPKVNDTLGDGIPKEGCINTPYELTVFLKTPSQITLMGFMVPIISIKIDTVRNLPEGLSISCSRPNCIIPADSLACFFITGTPTENNDTGTYLLEIDLLITTPFLGAIEVTFPDPTFAPGTYEFILNEEGSPNCLTSSLRELAAFDYTKIFPVPSDNIVNLHWKANLAEYTEIRLWHMTGQLIQTERIQAHQGLNDHQLQIDQLPPGLYWVDIRSKSNRSTLKLVKQ
jgi:hypothetical protein